MGTQPAVAPQEMESSPNPDRWANVMGLRCRLTVEFQIPGLKVGDLLKLETNSVIDAQHSDGTPVPLWVNGVMIGSAEFDVVGKQLAIRVTELR